MPWRRKARMQEDEAPAPERQTRRRRDRRDPPPSVSPRTGAALVALPHAWARPRRRGVKECGSGAHELAATVRAPVVELAGKSAQKVHSKLQIRASRVRAGNNCSQRSQAARISSTAGPSGPGRLGGLGRPGGAWSSPRWGFPGRLGQVLVGQTRRCAGQPGVGDGGAQ